MKFNLQDTFSTDLPADPNKNNTRRQVFHSCYSYAIPRVPSAPVVLHVSDFAQTLGITEQETQSDSFKEIFSGAKLIVGSTPYAMCYAGHQFGHWAGQLGDGRAINLGEVVYNNKRWALQLKGAGETPYSRTADGLAVLRSSIREHLCSEAMYHLGVPTTRSLSLCLTGDEVLRDMMYDGNAAYEKGAVVCRVAESFIRFGNFQIFASRGDKKTLQLLADYTIRQFYPEIDLGSESKYAALFAAVADRTLNMIVGWQRVGFVHGVMNTDNLSILGQTIDYGPYGWLEGYDRGWTPNTTDRQHKRYRYGNQPAIALWNLHQLGNALYSIEQVAEPFEKTLRGYQQKYVEAYFDMMRQKLGLNTEEKTDISLIEALELNLELTETDMTIFFRQLAQLTLSDTPASALDTVDFAFYKPAELVGEIKATWEVWMKQYLARLVQENRPVEEKTAAMNAVNPKYVLRNYMAQLAIDAADSGDYSLIDELYQLLKEPYAEQAENEKWFAKRPEWARHKVGCSMLSCSS